MMTARCKACWLKLALTGFQMRETDHDELRSLLPTCMQSSVPLAANRPTNLPWAPNRGQMIRLKGNSSSTSTVCLFATCPYLHALTFQSYLSQAPKTNAPANTVAAVSKVKIKTKRKDPSRKGNQHYQLVAK